MALFLEIYDGPQKGQRIPLTEGMVLGRKEAPGISLLQDSKVSSRHAKVEATPTGRLKLIDLGSANGIKVDGIKVTAVDLTPGLIFVLGKTPIRVYDGSEMTQEIVIEDRPPAVIWRDDLRATLTALQVQMVNRPRLELAPFSRVVLLEFVNGLQVGELWTLGYGPRQVGSEVPDLSLREIGAPGIAFELHPVQDQVLFMTSFSDQVQINGRGNETAYLKEGDLITFRSTKIRVGFAAPIGQRV